MFITCALLEHINNDDDDDDDDDDASETQWNTYARKPYAHYSVYNFAARSELRKVVFLALSVTFLFVYEISQEPLNGFAPNSHGRRVWSLARKSLNVKVIGQKSMSPGTKTAFFGGSLRAVYVW